ncbi:MAG: response regulator [Clostridiales bacterium]|nr:response regulator [Clostridiales bacterium]
MYSVFLVEDEILIREGIKQLVTWNLYGFEFIGEAPDGELAWPVIRKEKPDIVITDIKMPFMDGLSLSSLIKKEMPKTVVIILSGYDDFSYAKEAINIGVNQYLLKPLSKGQLIDVLLDVKKQKDEEFSQEQYRKQFANEVQEYLLSSRRDFFDALISGGASMPKLLEWARKLGLDLSAPCYNIVLFLLEGDVPEEKYTPSIEAVQGRVSQMFSDSGNFVAFNAGMGVTAFLVKAGKDKIIDYTNECYRQLSQACKPLEGHIYWVATVGEPVGRLSAIGECYKKARKSLFYKGSGKQGQASPVYMDFNPGEVDANKLTQSLIEKFLINGRQGDVENFVEDYFNGFDPSGANSVMFRHFVVLNIQFTVNAFLEKMISSTVDKNIQSKQELQEAISSIGASKQYTTRILSDALTKRDSAATNRYQEMLRDVIIYMKDNYSNPDMSLNTVAKTAHLAPTHFSAVFSQQMGKTFVEYLTELRMGKARELLLYSGSSNAEIALKVGYNDPHYFSYLFKKINGYSPREYRGGRRGND